jgi:hypothetical protein
MPRYLSVALLAAALALAAVGCGSSSTSSTSSTSSSATAPTGTAATQATASTPSEATTTTGAGTGQSGQGSAAGASSSSQTPENSIKTYGSAASSTLKGTLAAAAFSFFRAIAASNYAKVCEGLSASNRKGLEAFTKAKHEKGGCPTTLKMLIATRGVPEARKAAAGKLISVRVKGSTAFVIFQPKGGRPSYFVLKREGGAWRAISPSLGTPLNPLGGSGK